MAAASTSGSLLGSLDKGLQFIKDILSNKDDVLKNKIISYYIRSTKSGKFDVTGCKVNLLKLGSLVEDNFGLGNLDTGTSYYPPIRNMDTYIMTCILEMCNYESKTGYDLDEYVGFVTKFLRENYNRDLVIYKDAIDTNGKRVKMVDFEFLYYMLVACLHYIYTRLYLYRNNIATGVMRNSECDKLEFFMKALEAGGDDALYKQRKAEYRRKCFDDAIGLDKKQVDKVIGELKRETDIFQFLQKGGKRSGLYGKHSMRRRSRKRRSKRSSLIGKRSGPRGKRSRKVTRKHKRKGKSAKKKKTGKRR
jgi:hypothetical protein